VLGVRAADVQRQVLLGEGTVILGAGRGCAVVLRGERVAREHAKLQLSAQQARLSVFPHASPAVLNGVHVREAGLEPGDRIEVGDVQLTLHRADAIARVEVPTRGDAAAAITTIDERGEVDVVGATPPRSLAFLERLCRWALRGPSAARGEMLATLCGELRAEAGCAFVVEGLAKVTCLAAWGDPLPGVDAAAAALVTRRGRIDDVELVARGEWAAAGFTMPTGATFGLYVRGRDLASDAAELLRVATRLFGHDHLRDRAVAPRVEAPAAVPGLVFPPDIVVGRARAMRRLYEDLANVVDGPLPVLVLGETGVGKEHIARVLHDSSQRRSRPFVTINCAAIPAELLEAELFGIERGVATGVSERQGKFREAHGGTLFLDEIGELPLPLQAKLLRVLEERKVQPVGGQAAAVDLRILAATNLPLADVAASGRFRLDLFHRLAGFVVEVPPLRERAEDIPLLFGHFLASARTQPPHVAPQAVSALVRHRWSGNIRELRHEAVRVAARAGSEIGLADLSPSVAASFDVGGGLATAAYPDTRTLDGELARVEAALLAATIRECAGNVTHAAERLGISRARLGRRARELGVDRPR
jgi:transcriptional regulator with AAA-type ATPase domain